MTTRFSHSFTGADGAAWDTAAWNPVVLAGAGATDTIQSNKGRLTAPQNSLRIMRARMRPMDEVDVTGIVNAPSVTAYPLIYLRFSVPAANAAQYTGYRIEIQGNSSVFHVAKSLDGVDSYMGANVNAGVTFAPGNNVRFRCRIFGTTVQARFWMDGSAEPSTWAFSLPDSNPPPINAGVVGFGMANPSQATAQSGDFDDIVVTDNGTAAAPPASISDDFDAAYPGGTNVYNTHWYVPHDWAFVQQNSRIRATHAWNDLHNTQVLSSADMYAMCTIDLDQGTWVDGVGPMVRATINNNGTWTGYSLEAMRYNTNNLRWALRKSATSNGVGAYLVAETETAYRADARRWNNLLLEVEGNTLRGYVNGQLVVTYTDTTDPVTGPARGGISLHDSTVWVEYWEAGVLAAAPPPTPTGGMFKAWTGTEWKGTAKVWTGSEWKTGAKIWTGSEWKAV